MEKATRKKLVEIARQKAELPFHGYIEGEESNIEPMINLFPKWNIKDADKLWCAAFVYYCCIEAGFVIPYSPNECVTCSLAGCGGWEEYAIADCQIEYHKKEETFIPKAGDIVLYDRVFIDQEHEQVKFLEKNFTNYQKCLAYEQEVILFQQQEMYVAKQSKSM